MIRSRKPTVKELFQRLRRWFHSERQYAEILRLLCAMADTNVLLAEENARQLQNMRDLRDLVQRVVANDLHDPVVAHVQAHGIDIVEELTLKDGDVEEIHPCGYSRKEELEFRQFVLLYLRHAMPDDLLPRLTHYCKDQISEKRFWELRDRFLK